MTSNAQFAIAAATAILIGAAATQTVAVGEFPDKPDGHALLAVTCPDDVDVFVNDTPTDTRGSARLYRLALYSGNGADDVTVRFAREGRFVGEPVAHRVSLGSMAFAAFDHSQSKESDIAPAIVWLERRLRDYEASRYQMRGIDSSPVFVGIMTNIMRLHQESVGPIRAEIERAHQRVKELERKAAEARPRIALMQQAVDARQKELDARQADHDREKSELDTAEMERDDARTALDTATTEVATLSGELDDALTALGDLPNNATDADITAAKDKAITAAGSLQKKRAERDSLDTTVGTKEGTLASSEQEFENAKAELTAARTAHAEANETLNSAKQQLSGFEASIVTEHKAIGPHKDALLEAADELVRQIEEQLEVYPTQ